MRREGCRKRDFQAAPRLTVFLPRFKFFRLDVGQRKEKRRIHVGPHRIPCEVRQLQSVPGRLERVISEGLAWIGPFLNDLTVARLNRDSIGLEGRTSDGHCPERRPDPSLSRERPLAEDARKQSSSAATGRDPRWR